MRRIPGRAGGAVVVALMLWGCSDPVGGDYDFPPGRVTFSHLPIDLSGVISFVPMGEPNVLPKDHGGFPLANAYRFPASTAVLAVADGVVVQVSNGIREVPPIPDAPQQLWGTQYDDHLIRLKVSETITVNYAHVTDFHPAFAAKVGSLSRSEEAIDVFVPVEAGDTLGFVDPHSAMDFSVTDRSLDLAILNRDIIGPQYAADVYDYFEGPLLSQMIAIAARDAPPWGGRVDYDVVGRISGNWFREGTTSAIQWSRQLAIVYDHLHSDRVFISDGSPMRDVPGFEDPGRPDVWWVKGNAPRPEDIGVADGMIQYALIYPQSFTPGPIDDVAVPVQGVMLVQMLEPGRIRVEVFKGVTEASGFTAAAKIYER